MAIVPDTKDWTGVLQRRCPECRFDNLSFSRDDIPAMARENASGWRAPLTAISGQYESNDPANVAVDLTTVTPVQWQRRGDGATFTVETFARCFIHDPSTTSTTSPAGPLTREPRVPAAAAIGGQQRPGPRGG